MDHNVRQNLLSAALVSSLALGWAFAGSGCSTTPPPDQLAQAVRVGERPVAMEGSSTFFDGAVSATVTVSKGIGKGLPMGKGKHAAKVEMMPDVTAMDNDEAVAYVRARRAVGSPLPPVTIHLKLTNLTDGAVAIDIRDFDSDLGNFAVEPSPLTLSAHQEMEPEPMISQLGVTADDIAFKVTLSRGGKKETQTIHVKNLSEPPPPKS